jgi:hypothetical protein
LIEQRTAVIDWTNTESNADIVGEFAEDEDQSQGRPRLAAAIEACRKLGASLVVASTEVIGQGNPFYPRIMSVPVIKLPAPDRPLGHVKTVPAGTPSGLSLHFDNHAEGLRSDVYLCNNCTEPLGGATVRLTGATMDLVGEIDRCTAFAGQYPLSGPYVTPTQVVPIHTLEPGTAFLLTDYDDVLDGDLILVFDVSYIAPDGSAKKERAVIGKGGRPDTFVTVLPL